MTELPDPRRIDRIGLDTETTGLSYADRPVGLSWALPDGSHAYVPWSHGTAVGDEGWPEPRSMPSGLRRWVVDLLHSDAELIFHHALFDLRMLAYDSPEVREALQAVPGRRLHDTQFVAAIHDENRGDLSLEGLSAEYAPDEAKLGDDAELWAWLAAQSWTYSREATRKAQAKYISRAPANLVRPYAARDGLATLRTFEAMERAGLLNEGRLRQVYDLERRLLPVSLRMHLEGTPVNLERVAILEEQVAGELDAARARWEELAPGVNARSTSQLYTFFKDLAPKLLLNDGTGRTWDQAPMCMKKVPGKQERVIKGGFDALIGLTPTGNPSMAVSVLDGLPDNPYTEAIKALRKLEHYGGTFIQSYIRDELARSDDGKIHALFHQLRTGRYGTVSGRYSSSNPNLQNVPARDKVWAPRIRSLYVPLPGCAWGSADYSQIEYRYLAHYADLLARKYDRRSPLAEAYERDPDQDFHQAAADLAGMERKPAKNLNFAVVYGAGIDKLAKMLGCTIEDAREIYETYHRRVPDLKRMYDVADHRAQKRGYVWTWYGRRRRFTGRARNWTYRALNALLQGSAADLIKLATLNLVETGIVDWDSVVLHLTVHDELDLSIRHDRVPEVREQLHRGMTDLSGLYPDGFAGPGVLTSGVPVKVDVNIAADWGACSEYFADADLPWDNLEQGEDE